MSDVKASLKKDGDKQILVIEVPFDKKGSVSKSGKSLVHASTNGNQAVELKVGDKNLVLGINAYTKIDQ